MTKEIIKYENISFIRSDRKILDNINWTVNKGENWAILGLNGSGKSSIINMLTAYEIPTKGDISIFGEKFGYYDWTEIKQKIGFVSNTLNRFLPTLNNQTVKNIVLSGKYSSIGIYKEISEDDIKKADFLLKAFRLEHLESNKFKNLSQGEQRLTLLSRAFMNNPKILVLDEPCSGLDIRARENFLSSLEDQILQNNTTIIYITHNTEEILPSITHVAILKNGKIIAKGLKKEILTNTILSEAYSTDVEISWKNERPWTLVK